MVTQNVHAQNIGLVIALRPPFVCCTHMYFDPHAILTLKKNHRKNISAALLAVLKLRKLTSISGRSHIQSYAGSL